MWVPATHLVSSAVHAAPRDSTPPRASPSATCQHLDAVLESRTWTRTRAARFVSLAALFASVSEVLDGRYVIFLLRASPFPPMLTDVPNLPQAFPTRARMYFFSYLQRRVHLRVMPASGCSYWGVRASCTRLASLAATGPLRSHTKRVLLAEHDISRCWTKSRERWQCR